MKYSSWISAAGLVLAIFAVFLCEYRPATVNASDQTKPLLSDAEKAKDAGPLSPEDNFAWDEFAALVHPTDAPGTRPPEWLAWYTKCEAGLSDTCENPVQVPQKIPADQAAAEFPRQLIGDPKIISEGVFDSVLYNPVAADSMRRSNLGTASSLDLVIQQLDMQNLSGADRRMPAGTFALGSEIVKLIWEVITDDKEDTLSLYDPVNPPVNSDSPRLLPMSAWKTNYTLARDKTGRIDRTTPCVEPLTPYGTEDVPQTVPINCFYSFTVQKGSCPHFSHDVQLALSCGPGMKASFLVFLVGFHVMKLTPGNPDWVWSTYYWTRETNDNEKGKKRTGWNAPWNHFHQMTTTAIRENAGDHAVCYNPYLEGQDTNGLKANCLSCHSFAAYATNTQKVVSGTANGKKYPYPRATRLQDEQEYFRGAVQTSFVWSISTSQNRPGGAQDPPSVQNVPQEKLHNK
jgi:hypothetical protein